jgi:hypothetical protein
MRLEDCCLDIDLVVTAPFQRKEPEEDWVQALDSQIIPHFLFNLYTRANFLSFGSAPPFLHDADNVLFSYFSLVVRSLKESLVEADEQLNLYVEAHGQIYDLGKKVRGEQWDKTAGQRAQRHFRYFLLSLQSALDALADLVAVFLPGLIPNLRLGRGQFSRIEAWLDRPLPASGVVLTPQQHFLTQLYDILRPLVHAPPPERDWLPLMRMLRNKAAHLGDPVFRSVGLYDKSGKCYTFVPRQWPYIWERHVKPADASQPKDPNFFPDLCRQILIHQDVVTYAQGLRGKVCDVVSAATSVLNEAYEQFENLPLNQPALSELQGSSEHHEFEYFLPPESAGAD